MKKIALNLICILALAFAGTTTAMAESLDFGKVVDALDIKDQTKASAKEAWKKYKRQEVTWTGTLHEADIRDDEAKVYIANKSRPLHDGFNIYFVTKDTDKVAKLKRGQSVTVQGSIDDVKWKRDATVLKLRDAHIK